VSVSIGAPLGDQGGATALPWTLRERWDSDLSEDLVYWEIWKLRWKKRLWKRTTLPIAAPLGIGWRVYSLGTLRDSKWVLGNTASLSIRELLEGNLAGGLLYWELWKLGLISTQRQNQKLILDLSLTAKTTVLSFTRTQSKVVIGLIIGDYTLRRHFYLMGLTNSLFVGGMEQRKKPQPMFCVTAKLWLHSYTHVWAPFFWTQRMFKSLSQWVNQNFCKDTGLPWLGIRLCGTKGPSKGPGATGPNGLKPNHYLHLPTLPEAPLILLVPCFFVVLFI
jgi:hypothetical protein